MAKIKFQFVLGLHPNQESMVLLVEKLTTNIKSETAEIVSKLKDKVSADLYEQNAKAGFILDGSK